MHDDEDGKPIRQCMIIEAKQKPKKGSKKENGESMQLRSRRLYKSPPIIKLINKRKLMKVVEKEDIKLVDNLDQDLEQKHERAMRERTPEHLIMKSEYIIATGCSTKAPRDDVAAYGPPPTRGLQGIFVPSSENIESFFDASERQQQKHFTEKYNFNFKNETPLPGRYEWVKVEP